MTLFEPTETFAALDLGTTNCRLLVARPSRPGMAGRGGGGVEGLRVIDSFSRIVRLGEGLQASGRLSEAAMARTIEALAICADKIRHRGVTLGRFVATEACRRASNIEEFLDRVREATELELEIIPAAEEARLALTGCAPLLDPRFAHAIVFDIGGGSTEILWVEVRGRRDGGIETQIRAVHSIPVGVVTLTERFGAERLGGGLAGSLAFAPMVLEVRQALRDFDAAWDIAKIVRRGLVQMIGSSGTVTTLAGIRLGLPRYDRSRVDGTMLGFDEIMRLSARIVGLDAFARAAEPCIGPNRADLMVAGCAILSAICTTWPVGRLRVGDRGVREGILADLVAYEAATRRAPAAHAAPTPHTAPAMGVQAS